MKHLTIIVPDGDNNLSSIVGAHKIFTRANDYWRGAQELFAIQVAGISQKVHFFDRGTTGREIRDDTEINNPYNRY